MLVFEDASHRGAGRQIFDLAFCALRADMHEGNAGFSPNARGLGYLNREFTSVDPAMNESFSDVPLGVPDVIATLIGLKAGGRLCSEGDVPTGGVITFLHLSPYRGGVLHISGIEGRPPGW